VPRDYGNGAIVCVCNMTYCDDLPNINKQDKAVVLMYETNKNGLRFKENKLKFGEKKNSLESNATLVQTISINRDKKFQRIIGFGGAFTDAAGINIASLPLNMQQNVMKDYFAPNGLEYSMGRIPIGGCDFSTHPYSYDDHPGDINLTQFKSAKEDYLYKVRQDKNTK
jgi:glucosylceramidase